MCNTRPESCDYSASRVLRQITVLELTKCAEIIIFLYLDHLISSSTILLLVLK